MTLRQTQPGLMPGALLLMLFSTPLVAHAPDADPDSFPAGVVQAQIDHHPQIDGLQLTLLEGPRQGLLLSYRGEETLMLFGTEGEPMLRISTDGVAANTLSPTWRKSQNKSLSEADTEARDWQPVAAGGRYAWIDPRLSLDLDEAPADPEGLGDWHVHLEIDGEAACNGISGSYRWHELSDEQSHAHHD